MPLGARAGRWARLALSLTLLAGSGVVAVTIRAGHGGGQGAEPGVGPGERRASPETAAPAAEKNPPQERSAPPWEGRVLWLEAGPGEKERWPVPAGLLAKTDDGRVGPASPGQEEERLATWDPSRLVAVLKSLAPEVYRAPRNARLHPRTGRLLPEEEGRALDLEASRRRIEEALQSAPRSTGAITVRLVTRPLEPTTTLRELRAAAPTRRLARYSTYFDPTESGRTANIRLAARRLDGLVISPGERFSFNGTLGPRLVELGWQEAPELQGGEFVKGIGGGICQVSSTLFNAVLLAGAEIVARQNHSRPVGYVPLGRDATVAWDAIDFQFRNPYPFSLVLQAEVAENRLSLSVWGASQGLDEARQRFEVVVEELLTVPPPPGVNWKLDTGLPAGEERIEEPARPGYQVRTVRVLYQNGRPVQREVVATSYYPPAPARGRRHPLSAGPRRP